MSTAEVVTCRRPETIEALLAEHAVDAVLLDMNFGPGESSGKQGLQWLERILEIDPEELFAEGSPGDRGFIIKEGQLEVLKTSGGREVLLDVQGPGAVIGEMALLDDQPRSATVVALDMVRALCIEKLVQVGRRAGYPGIAQNGRPTQ